MRNTAEAPVLIQPSRKPLDIGLPITPDQKYPFAPEERFAIDPDAERYATKIIQESVAFSLKDHKPPKSADNILNGQVIDRVIPKQALIDKQQVQRRLDASAINKALSVVLPKESLAGESNGNTITLPDQTEIVVIGQGHLLFKRPVLNGEEIIGQQMQSMRDPDITTRIDSKSNDPVVSIRATQKDMVNGVSEIVIGSTGGVIDGNRPLAMQYTEMVPFVGEEKPLPRGGAILEVESVAKKIKTEHKQIPLVVEETLFDVQIRQEEACADAEYLLTRSDAAAHKLMHEIAKIH